MQADFGGAFLCWVLEHIPEPARVQSVGYRRISTETKTYHPDKRRDVRLPDGAPPCS